MLKAISFRHYCALTLLVAAPSVSFAANLTCHQVFAPALTLVKTSASLQDILEPYCSISGTKYFLEDASAVQASQRITEILKNVDTSDEFVRGVELLLGNKGETYMGGLADDNFGKYVLPGLLVASRSHKLTYSQRLQISEALKSFAVSPSGSKGAVKLSLQLWGATPFVHEVQNITNRPDFSGFLSDMDANQSADKLMQVVSRAANGSEFVDALKAVLGWKVNRYFGGLADQNFYNIILSDLLKASEAYEINDIEKKEIYSYLQSIATSEIRSVREALNSYTHEAWGKNIFRNQILRFTSSERFNGFLFDADAANSTEAIMAIASKAKNGSEFVQAMDAVLSWKVSRYMGGLADNNFSKYILRGFLNLSKKYELTADQRGEIKEILNRFATTANGDKSATKLINMGWGS